MLLIQFWVLDEDTGLRKYGSPWFNYDNNKEDIEKWLKDIPVNRKVVEKCKYIKED